MPDQRLLNCSRLPIDWVPLHFCQITPFQIEFEEWVSKSYDLRRGFQFTYFIRVKFNYLFGITLLLRWKEVRFLKRNLLPLFLQVWPTPFSQWGQFNLLSWIISMIMTKMLDWNLVALFVCNRGVYHQK